jgi:hypothetical protein
LNGDGSEQTFYVAVLTDENSIERDSETNRVEVSAIGQTADGDDVIAKVAYDPTVTDSLSVQVAIGKDGFAGLDVSTISHQRQWYRTIPPRRPKYRP